MKKEELLIEEEVTRRRQLVLDEAREKTNTFELSNQSVIELAYITKDMVELCIKGKYKLLFDEANCYLSCFHICKTLLASVDPLYLDCHQYLYEFYHRKDNKCPSNDLDILQWEDEEERRKWVLKAKRQIKEMRLKLKERQSKGSKKK